MTEGRDSDLPDELLSQGIRFAWTVAVEESRAADGPDLPSALLPLVGFRRLTGPAGRTVRRVLSEDEEFRKRVAAHEGAGRLDRASRLFIARPEGWREELEGLAVAVATADAEDADRSAREQVADLRRALAEARAEVSSVALEAQARERRLADQIDAAAADAARLTELEGQVEELTRARQKAVRELKLTEKRLAERTAQWRELSAELDRRNDPEKMSESPADTAAVPESTTAAPAAVGEPAMTLGEAELAEVAGHIGAVAEILRLSSVDPGPGPSEGPDPQPSRTAVGGSGTRRGGARRGRRIPRMGRGLMADSEEGAEWLATRPGAVILVDGYNVAISTWGHLDIALQRERLRAVAEGFAARTGAKIHLVFDGAGAGAPVAARSGSDVRSEFTPDAVEADDRILEMIGAFPLDAPLVVVSDDRRVRRGADDRGAAVVGVAAFVGAAG